MTCRFLVYMYVSPSNVSTFTSGFLAIIAKERAYLRKSM